MEEWPVKLNNSIKKIMYCVIFSDTEHSDTGSSMSESACYSIGGGTVCVHISDFKKPAVYMMILLLIMNTVSCLQCKCNTFSLVRHKATFIVLVLSYIVCACVREIIGVVCPC